jgi:hypothetical protein
MRISIKEQTFEKYSIADNIISSTNTSVMYHDYQL